MPTVLEDKIEDLQVEEQYGSLVKLVRRFIVVDLTGYSDYTVLLDALEEAGIPAADSELTGGTNLIATNRSVRMMDKDKAVVDVTYSHYHNEGQNFDNPPVGLQTGELRVNIQQVDTNKDENGDMIELSHTYPSDDKDYGGQTKTQVGKISVFSAQRTQSYKGIKQTQTPWLIANQLVGNLNSIAWSGGEVRTWMCTGVTWQIMDATEGANRYFMSFEFQYNPDGWDPTAIFIDDRTNQPPKDLVEGTGYKTIEYQGEVDFENIIGTSLQGG